MNGNISRLLAASLLVGALSVQAQVSWSPLTTFGANGWLAPGSSGLVTGTADRGLAFADNFVYYASGSQVFEIDPNTGALIGGLATGFSGGTYLVDQLAAGSDGTLYVGNLTTSGSSPFKLYSYANPTSSGYRSDRLLQWLTQAADQPDWATLWPPLAAAVQSPSRRVVALAAGGYTVINGGVGTAVSVSGTLTPGFDKAITFVNSGQVIGLADWWHVLRHHFFGQRGHADVVAGTSIP